MRINCTPTPQKHGRPYPDDIDRLTNAVTSAFMVEELYLFGSAATGTLKETSDIDLAIALKAPEREKRTATPTTDWREHAKRGLAAERRRETAIETTFRKAVGWRRAIDIVFLQPGEANEETTTDDVVHAIQNEGVSLVEDGAPIPFTQAVTRGAVGPKAEAKTRNTTSRLFDMNEQSYRLMVWAMLRAGRKNPGPTRRHQIAYIAARGRPECPAAQNPGRRPRATNTGRSSHARSTASRELGDSRPIPAEKLQRLASNQQRWRFTGDEAPTMTEMLQSVWDAATALDTIKTRKARAYYRTTGITRLKCNLAILAGLVIDPVSGFDAGQRILVFG